MFNFHNHLLKFLQPLSYRHYYKTGQKLIKTYRTSSIEDMEKNLTVYGDYASPPVRFVLMTASLLKIELNFHEIDLFKSENKSKFYTKINPLQKVPALTVGNDTIYDSHAIALYLCRRNIHQKLYPIDDIIQNANIDQMLYFNATTLFPINSEIHGDHFSGKWPLVESKVNYWHKAVDFLESRLKIHKYLVADKMLLCDLCCVQTVLSMSTIVPLLERHQRVGEWVEIMEKLPCNDINRRGLDRLRNAVKNIKSNKTENS